jgi:two-component system LytT family response regulator
VYYSSRKIIENLNISAYTYDILILNADDDESFVIAKMLRSINLAASVLFTSLVNFPRAEIFKYRPSGFINDLQPSTIIHAFQNAYHEQHSKKNVFMIRTKDSIIKFNHDEIDYFTNNLRTVTLHSITKKTRVDFNAKFEDIYDMLPKDIFLKCHQSIIINMGKIHKIVKSTREFILNSGESIEIARRTLQDAITSYEAYCNMRI